MGPHLNVNVLPLAAPELYSALKAARERSARDSFELKILDHAYHLLEDSIEGVVADTYEINVHNPIEFLTAVHRYNFDFPYTPDAMRVLINTFSWNAWVSPQDFPTYVLSVKEWIDYLDLRRSRSTVNT